MSYDMCVMQWLIATINKRNKRMLKADAVLKVMVRIPTYAKC